MTLPSNTFTPNDDAPDSSCPTVRYPDLSTYEGLDVEMIERADSVFPPPPSEPEPDAWREPFALAPSAKWLEQLDS